uniref:Predicted protein putative n=1 Tax=Albugo laibachii Nc14 TaxID=890382 RepID=F0WME2_9STRA|nr:predicted protein putative [Albugo laibachii Nc14]|eukprot:CCA22474.1 predicted protein putative [Albugo laibachii Nc14]
MYSSSSSSSSTTFTSTFSTLKSLVPSPTRSLDGLTTQSKQSSTRAEDEWSEFLSSSVAALAETTMNRIKEENPEQSVVATEAGESQYQSSSPSLSTSPIEKKSNTSHREGESWKIAMEHPKARIKSASSHKLRSYSTGDSFSVCSVGSPESSHWRPLGHRSMRAAKFTDNQMKENGSAEDEMQNSDTVLQGNMTHLNKSLKKERARTASFRDIVSCFGEHDSDTRHYKTNDDGNRSDEKKSLQEQSESLRLCSDELQKVGLSISCSPLMKNVSNGVDDGDGKMVEDTGKKQDEQTDEENLDSMYVKSPVLRTRQDPQTWQFQGDDLHHSPQSARCRVASSDVMSSYASEHLQETTSNQVENGDEIRFRNRSKDLRATSVDFTLRPDGILPPLPPVEEPLHRLRAKSFSFSASQNHSSAHSEMEGRDLSWPVYPKQFGLRSRHSSNGFFTMKPGVMRSTAAPPSHLGHPVPPQPNVVHSAHFHGTKEHDQLIVDMNGLSMHTCQSSVPFHLGPPYPQYGPQGSYRRCSGESFAGLAHPANRNPQPPHPHNGARGSRGAVNINMMYYQSNQPTEMRIFPAPPPPAEPHVAMIASSGNNYDWARSSTEVVPSPPFPRSSQLPFSRPFSPPEAHYEVEFKRGRQEMFSGARNFNAGDYVKVEADRGEDIGRIARQISDLKPAGVTEDVLGLNRDDALGPARHEGYSKRIICLATQREIEMLLEQRREESEVFEVCKSKVRQRLLPMNVIDAEYQFDRHKLTFFFEAERRIDFRELVRDLFAIYKTRIWLQQVISNGKKPGCLEVEMLR